MADGTKQARREDCLLPPGGRACQWAALMPEACEKCGWYADEAARRKPIPLARDEDGLRRKHIGVGNKPGRT